MLEHEVIKTTKIFIENKTFTVICISLPLVLTVFDYNALQVILLSSGWVFVLAALFMLYANYKKRSQWVPVTGRVIDIEWHDEILNSGQTVKYGQEVITYRTRSANRYTVMNGISDTKPQKRGQKIKIFYDPEAEQEILVYDLYNMYIKFLMLILFGAMMIYYGLGEGR